MQITRNGYYTITGPDGGLLRKPDGSVRQVTSRDECYERITEDGRAGVFTIHCPDRTVRVVGSVADQGSGDTEAPTVPTGLVATAINKNRIDLTWNASTDNVGVSGYQIFRGGSPLNTVDHPTVTYSDTTVLPSTLYSYTVAAYDASGNTSAESGADTETTPANSAPQWTPVPDQTLIVGDSVNLDLEDYADDADVEALTYSIVSGTLPTGLSLSGSVISGTPTTSGQSATITVRADDGSATADDTFDMDTYDADVTAPPVPTGLSSNSQTASTISLSWNASTDSAGSANEYVSGTANYKLYRDSGLVVTQAGLTYQDSGLSSSTEYDYTISAIDVEGNESSQSSVVSVSTISATPAYELITEDTLIQLYPKSVWLRKVIVGTPGQETITVTNPSAASIALTSYVNSNSEYDITGLSQTESFSPGQTKTFTIDYNPSVGGSIVQTGSLTLNFDNGQTKVIQIWSSKFDTDTAPIPVYFSQALDVEGTNYQLQNDIDVAGTAFIIKANHISLDLNGFTVKYGSGGASGVHGIWNIATFVDPTNGGSALGLHVYNGTIEQSGYATASSIGNNNHAIYMDRSGASVETEFNNLTINVDGHGAHLFKTNDISNATWFHNNTGNLKTTSIDNRHNGDGFAVKLYQTVSSPRRPRIHDCVVSGNSQGAFFTPNVGGSGLTSEFGGQIYNNEIYSNGMFVNDHGIVPGQNADVFGNLIDTLLTSGRGYRCTNGTHLYDNTAIVIDGGYYDTDDVAPWVGPGTGTQIGGVYGVQCEDASSDMRIYNNNLTCYADVADGTGLRTTSVTGTNNKIFRNTFTSKRVGSTSLEAFGHSMDFGGTPDASGYDIENNDFIFDSALYSSDFNGMILFTYRKNRFSVGLNPQAVPLLVQTWSGFPVTKDLAFIDNELTGITYADTLATASGGGVELHNAWTLTLIITTDGVTPLSGATVVIDDQDALQVLNTTTPANGTLSPELTENHRTQAPAGAPQVVDDKTPHDITVTAGGFSQATYQITMDSIKTLTINMTTGVGIES